ncbi:heterokaryon incompatibility protein-domain-containing protein [Parachaetomium inaequale]|uniref:Heterokaryon incompatibility protein-domain-containing protein n=1 Tax=Parachaetomium inaequale TaxID=2588326 RepID=A0AAN6SN97_9PEZI|nr:heterokaryon incompatibility protein-domain-containing protein [Parachaetomium inaequale]
MTPPTPQKYPYLPLDPSTHEIRLLTLSYPRSSPAPLSNTPPPDEPAYTLTLTHAPLTSPTTPPPLFSALSYVWGTPTTSSPLPILVINAHPVPVTPNLHSAIARLARQRWTGQIWIDALCINQADTAEKNWQVLLMSRIYRVAEQVLIWLGPEHDGGALHAVRELGVLFREQVTEVEGGWGRVEGFVKTVVGFSITNTDADGDGEGGRKGRVGFDFEAIWRLFRGRPWWRRVWIIQEVVLARKAVVLCGADPGAGVTSVPWEDVSEYMDGVGMPLLDTIIWTSFGTSADSAIQATDPRDRIYGLLGMMRERDRRRIPVEYSPEMTINRVLFAVGKALLEDHGPDVLSFCQQPPGHPSKDLPSWVPDWTAPRTMTLIGGVSLGTDNEARLRGDASGGANWRDWAPKSRVEDVVYEHPVVSLPGIVVAQVEVVCQGFITAPGSASYLDDCRDWLLEINDMVNESLDKSRNAEFDKETWRVPVADFGLAEADDAEGPSRFIHGFDVLTGKLSPPPELGSDAAKRDWVTAESWDYRRVWKVYGRRAFIDNAGRPGLGPAGMVAGDKVVVLAGARVPFILRLESGTSTHRVSESSSFHNIQLV